MKIYKVLITVTIITAGVIYYSIKANQSNHIPLETIFSNSNKLKPSISPDGKYYAHLQPVNNVANIFVSKFNDNIFKQITHEKEQNIYEYYWSYDGKYIFYIKDTHGDENDHILRVDLETLQTTDITPFKDVKVEILSYLKQYPDRLIIAMNKENKKLNDVYELNLNTGELKLLEKNPGKIGNWLIDRQLNVRGAFEMLPDGGFNLLIKDEANQKWNVLINRKADELILNNGYTEFSGDGKFLYMTDLRDCNASKLIKFNIADKTSTVIAADPEYDIDSVITDSDTYEIQAISFYKDRSVWKIIDPQIKDDFENITKLDSGDINISTKNDRFWLVSFDKDNGPAAFWMYDRQTKKSSFLFHNKPELLKYKLANMNPVSFNARDGLCIHGYITYPVNKERKNLPLILNVHGGPWARDFWGYNPEVQWLANRGYTVLQVNYRGSTGYGKNFTNAGNQQWSLKMQDDLVDAVQWAISLGTIDTKKIAIYGGSYGGYAALVGATLTPDLFCCAVDICGISNLLTFFESIPPTWSSYASILYNKVGNPNTQKDFLIACSPLFKADKIKIPLLIAQGANDPRVKQAESEQIVNILKEKNLPHEYLLFNNEGHGFCKFENRLKFYQQAEKFLARHLLAN